MSEQPGERSDQVREKSSEKGSMNVPDEDLPDDVRPGEDNPLAEPAGEDVPDDVVGDVEPTGREETSSRDGDDGAEPG
jgi:hypothetical protein